MDRKARVEFSFSWRAARAFALFACLACALGLSSGCVHLFANLMRGVVGDDVPAKFDGLKDKRVAVVCVASTGTAFGAISATDQLAIKIGERLKMHVKKIEMVEHDQVEAWIDENDWNESDYLAIGKGVDAQLLVVIELDSYSLHDGPTMYKGRANTTVRVLDIEKNGKIVYQTDPAMIQFPANAGHQTTEMKADQFERRFIIELAGRIARHFHPYDRFEEMMIDTPNLR